MNPRNQVEIKIHKNDYLTISFIGDINFAGRWYGTPETLREKLRSFPHKSEREKVLNIVADIINNRITYLREEKPEYFIRHRERGNFNELQATEGEFLLLRIREELRQKAGEQG